MRPISDLTPTYINGELVFVEKGLGTVASVTTTANNITQVGMAVNNLVPNKPVNYQSDFSKVSNVVATGAATVAAVAAVLPPPGQLVAAVAGVVAVAATLLGKVFANSKAKAYAAERQQYEEAIASIKTENTQLDQSYAQTKSMIEQLKAQLRSVGLGCPDTMLDNGLGLCIINCKAKKEKSKLEQAKEDYAYYTNLQQQKIVAMQNLLDEYNKLMAGALKVNEIDALNNKLIIGGIGLAAVIFVVALYKAD